MEEKLVSPERANQSLKAFITAVSKLASAHQLSYELIIGAANSGISMIYLYQLAMQKLHITMPQTLLLPVYRPESPLYKGNDIDHDILLAQVTSRLRELPNVVSILFLDDEIGAGTAAHIALDLLIKAAAETNSTIRSYTIMAEDLGFQNTYRNDVEVSFIPISKHPLDGVYNVLSGLVPQELSEIIRHEIAQSPLRRSEIFNIALGLPIKARRENVPELKVIPLANNLEKECRQFRDGLSAQVNEYLISE